MFGIHWTMPIVLGPQWIINGQKATPSEISWFGNIIVYLINNTLAVIRAVCKYRCVTQTLPPVTDLFCQFSDVCHIFSGATAKDF